jgi:hypothetical protein
MIRFFLRLVGVLFLAAAFVAVVIDGTRTIAARQLTVTDLKTTIGQLSTAALTSVESTLQSASGILGSLLAFLLAQPSAAVFALLGIVLMLLGRRRHRRHVGFAT